MAERLQIPLHKHTLGDEEIEAATRVLRSPWLTHGEEVEAFEEEFAKFVGAQYAVATSSCTAALYLALRARGVVPGDYVAVPTLTFAATANAVAMTGARVALLDIKADTLQIAEWSPQGEPRLTVSVRYAGLDVPDTNHPRIVDSAHALLPADSWATCYSFYTTKPITTGGEGGMLATNSKHTAAFARRARLQGLLHGKSGHADDLSPADCVQEGFKFNMTNVQAAIGRVQLRRAPSLRRARTYVAQAYTLAFGPSKEIERPAQPIHDPLGFGPSREHDWHLYVIRLHLDKLRCSRDEFIAALRARGVEASYQWKPLHRHPKWWAPPESFPVAEAEWVRLVSLPIWPGMADAEIEHVIEAVKAVIAENRRANG